MWPHGWARRPPGFAVRAPESVQASESPEKSPLICPHCGRDAPIVYRGVVPSCTACGALRAPLSTPSINLTGKSSRVGGTVASVAGWLVLLIGLSFELGLGLLLWTIFSVALALAVALPLALVSTVIGVALLRGGTSLRRSGANAERAVRDQALLSMAGHHGPVTATDAARLLNVSVSAADDMLTELAKRDPDRITVDVDDQGVIRYRLANLFSNLQSASGAPDEGRVRVGALSTDEGEAEEATEEASRDAETRRSR